MEYTAIVTVLALLQYTVFGFQVGGLRTRAGINAPATTGDPDFERMFRVHQNTLEQLVVFLPSLWLFAYFVNPVWGAGIGLVYIVGRFVYAAEYRKDPASRGPGMTIGFIATVILLIGALANVVRNLL